MKRLLLICGLALAFAPAALATSTVSVSPASPVFGQSYTLSGCGYTPGASLLVTVTTAPSIVSQRLTPDSVGCFTSTWTASWVGDYRASVFVIRKNGKSLILEATADYVVALP